MHGGRPGGQLPLTIDTADALVPCVARSAWLGQMLDVQALHVIDHRPAAPDDAGRAGEEDWPCGACGSSAPLARDPLLLCDNTPFCSGSAHLSCAGLAEVPGGAWYCPLCAAHPVTRASASAGPGGGGGAVDDTVTVLVAWQGLSLGEATWETPSELRRLAPKGHLVLERYASWFHASRRHALSRTIGHTRRTETRRPAFDAVGLPKADPDTHVLPVITGGERWTMGSATACHADGNRAGGSAVLEETLMDEAPPRKAPTPQELMSYQVDGINWLLGNWCRGRNSLLADGE